MNKTEKILELAKHNPDLKNREIAEEVKCSRRLVRLVRNEWNVDGNNAPKILLFDIETLPMEVYVWGLYKQRIPISNVIKDWSMLSWSAKWLFDDNIMMQKVKGTEAKERTDKSIMQGLWDLVDKADILIGHNALKFDVRKMNLRFALNGLIPPMPYRVIDTMKHAMKIFGSSSFKLDYLNKIFGLNLKEHAPYEWWVESAQGNDAAITKIADYNKVDVAILEELYLTLRPWLKSHPNIALYIDTEGTICTNCGNPDLDWGGYYITVAGRYKAFRCNNCSAIGRSRISDLTKEDRAKLLLSVAS